jgi:hypothetical protein
VKGASFRLHGIDLVATHAGALYWPAGRTLIAADLHLEKGSSLARRGALLPPYDSAATLARLEAVLASFPSDRVICLGDSFHDPGGPARLAEAERARLEALSRGRDWIWVAGNHDPAATVAAVGRVAETLSLGALVFRHEAATGQAAGEISGHLHPKACVDTGGGRLSGRCFVTDGRRLVLPAFGAYAGGLDVFDAAFAAVLDSPFTVFLVGRNEVHVFASGRLSGAPTGFGAHRRPRDPGSAGF